MRKLNRFFSFTQRTEIGANIFDNFLFLVVLLDILVEDGTPAPARLLNNALLCRFLTKDFIWEDKKEESSSLFRPDSGTRNTLLLAVYCKWKHFFYFTCLISVAVIFSTLIPPLVLLLLLLPLIHFYRINTNSFVLFNNY